MDRKTCLLVLFVGKKNCNLQKTFLIENAFGVKKILLITWCRRFEAKKSRYNRFCHQVVDTKPHTHTHTHTHSLLYSLYFTHTLTHTHKAARPCSHVHTLTNKRLNVQIPKMYHRDGLKLNLTNLFS